MRKHTLDQVAIASVEYLLDEPRLTDEDKVAALRGVIAEHHRQQGVRYILPRRKIGA